MDFTEKKITDGLRVAEQQEIRDSYTEYMGDLANILNIDTIQSGVHIEFGDNPVEFEKTLEAIGFMKHIGQDLKVFHGRVQSDYIYNIAGQRVESLLKTHGPITTLDLLQSKKWETYDHFGMYDHIASEGDSIFSTVFVTNNKDSVNPESTSIKKSPSDIGIIIGQYSVYKPSMQEEYGEYVDLARFVKEKSNEQESLAELSDMVILNEASLSMPRRSYLLAIGSQHEFNLAGSGVRADNRFYYDNGRIFPVPIIEDSEEL